MKTSLKLLSLSSVAAISLVGQHAHAAFVNPAFFGQPNTTYQEWDGFTTATGANTPSVSANTSGAAAWTDITSDTDGAFIIGTAPSAHIYSFAGNLSPEIVLPNPNLGHGYLTTIVLQVATSGGSIPQSAFSLTPLGGSSLSPLSAVVDSIASTSPFGDTSDDTWLVTWTLPGNVASYTIDYPVGATSISQEAARVDTSVTATPEPASLGLVGAGLTLLTLRRRRAC